MTLCAVVKRLDLLKGDILADISVYPPSRQLHCDFRFWYWLKEVTDTVLDKDVIFQVFKQSRIYDKQVTGK